MIYKKCNPPENSINNKFDFFSEINIKKDALSRILSNKCISSNMDHDNLWEVTIVPPQTTFSSDTIVLSPRTLSTISEQESKQDLSFNGNKEEIENGCRSTKESKITSLSSSYQKLNDDISHLSHQSNKRLSRALYENEKKLHDRINKKISKENTCSQICPDINNASRAPCIELGAVHKILDFITNSDGKVSSLTNNYYNEILRILQCLLAQRNDERLEDLLLKDSSFYKCECCGVISYIPELCPATKELKENSTKTRTRDAKITTVERDYDQNKKELKISINLPDLKNNTQSRISVGGSKIDCRAIYKDQLNGIELLPIKKRALAMRDCIGNPNEVNNISDTETDVNIKIKHKSLNNNTIKRLFTDFETAKRDKKYDYNSIMRNNNLNRCESSTMKAYADIDKEQIVRKISYERKSQIDDMLVGDMRSKTAHDMYPVIDTMKYLVRDQFTILDKQKDELFSKLREKHCTHLENARNGQSTILYSSRDDYPQRDSGFWLFDKSGHLPEIVLDEYRYFPMSRLNGNRENVDFSMNKLPCPNIREKIKNTNNNYIEKDSLEDLLEQGRESDTTAFSSSSAENLIHEWIESLDRKYNINNIDGDISRGRKLVSSRASLDIARHVRAQIANDRRSNNDKKSMRKIQAHDLDIFAQLSPKIRRKIYHLIQKIVSSDSAKDSASYQEKYLMTDTLNNEKLHSKSVDASFVHSNEITNNCVNDCISAKLSELLEDENYLCKRQESFINIYNQDLNNSKDSVKIPYENTAISTSPDKFGKTTRLSDNFMRKVTRHIIYKDASLKDIVGNNKHTVTNISTIYRKILENSENMDWDSFRKLVEILHPGQKELWRNICKTINEEASRIIDTDDNTEVCIEISPLVNPENILKASKVTTYTREIVFELDMTLKDVETLFNKKPAEKHLDT